MRPGSATPATASRPRPGVGANFAQQIVRKGGASPLFADLFHDVLTMKWSWFLVAIFGLQIAGNLAFAILYWIGGDDISNTKGFLDHFYFSVQTWATIGYGGMTPTTTWANMVVVVESAASTIFTAVTTGLVFAKFARPSVRVLFAKNCVITLKDGKRVLMFRVANERGNYIVEASARVSILRDEVSKEGERMRRVLDLTLVRNVQPIFLLSWTVMHEIDDSSPLAKVVDAATLAAEDIRISISLTAFDGTLSQTIHATHIYTPEDVHWGMRYVDVIETLPDGKISIDFTKFHDVIPLPALPPAPASPAA